MHVRIVPIFKWAKYGTKDQPTETIWCVSCSNAEGMIPSEKGEIWGSWPKGYRKPKNRFLRFIQWID